MVIVWDYHRLKSFERGGNIAKHYAYQKKSIIQVGKFVFVHGGIGHALASKYTIHELNAIVRKWLLKEGTEKDDEVFDEIFRSDDDISPFGVDCIQKKIMKMKIPNKDLINC